MATVKASVSGPVNGRIHEDAGHLQRHLRCRLAYKDGSGGTAIITSIWRHIMTIREKIDNAVFATVIIIGLPMLIVAAQRIAM